MRGRTADKLVLRSRDQVYLRDLLHQGQTPLKVARRAQVLLSRAEGQERIVTLSRRTELHVSTIWRICERYRQSGVEPALYDAPRSGRPRAFSPAATACR